MSGTQVFFQRSSLKSEEKGPMYDTKAAATRVSPTSSNFSFWNCQTLLLHLTFSSASPPTSLPARLRLLQRALASATTAAFLSSACQSCSLRALTLPTISATLSQTSLSSAKATFALASASAASSARGFTTLQILLYLITLTTNPQRFAAASDLDIISFLLKPGVSMIG